MDNNTSILVTTLDGDTLLRTAIKANNQVLTEDVVEYYREPENEAVLQNLLPEHCKGKIVEVLEIFEVLVK